jgi:Na+-transporting NADH:ubiquinone oxidoreductase subunit C
MFGNGLWDWISGFVALDKDLNKVVGVAFDHKAETPGLGARISSDEIQDRYKGKEIFDYEGNLISIKMLKKEKNPALSIHEVDGMSGATITANGLNDMMKNYLDCYLPFILKNKNLDQTLISYNE